MNKTYFWSVWVVVTGMLFLTGGCRTSFLNAPAVLPTTRPTASRELGYMVSTDRTDSKQNMFRAFFFPRSKKVQAWIRRDELRLKRVKEIYTADSVRTEEDKWNAGIIFLHGGGAITLEDTINYRIAYTLFNDLALNGSTSGIKSEGRFRRNQVERRMDDLRRQYSLETHNPIPVLPHGRN